MGKNCRVYSTHDFYCICCGSKGIPLQRSHNALKGANHRKRMYCYVCQHTVNHVECRTYEEVEAFKKDFENGLFKEEAEAELAYEKEHPQYQMIITQVSSKKKKGKR